MPLLPRLSSFWRNLFRKDRVEQELTEEVEAYLEMLVEAKIKEGRKPEEARRAALIEVGGVEQVKERVREVRMGHLLETLWQDLRYGARVLVKNPGFTSVAIITLALGIGANTAIFSVVNAALLRPLPFPEPERLVRLYEKETDAAVPSEREEVAPANFLDWKQQSQTLTEIAAWGAEEQPLTSQEKAESVAAAFVSANFFSALGMSPLHGRVFTPEEDQPGHDSVALLGYGLWQRRFGGDRNLIGQRVNLDGFQYTVVGIMPPGFQYPRGAEIWTPLSLNLNQTQTREAHFLQVIARCRPDASLAQVRAEMETIAASLAQQYPATNKEWTVNVIPLLEDEVGHVRPTMMLLMGAAGLVLLIACANASSLLLARGKARQTEITIRLALGASRWRIVRQLLTESTMLAGLGGGLGLVLALWGTEALLALSPLEIPRLQAFGVDLRVLGFTVSLMLLVGLVFGLFPAIQATRFNFHESLKEGGRRASGGHAYNRFFAGLVVSEVALALVVLVGAGLLLNSFLRLRRVDVGIQTENTLTVEVTLPSARYSGDDWKAQRLNFYGQAIGRIAALPGVVSAGAIDSLPLGGHERVWTFRKEGQTMPPSERPVAGFQVATTDYFRTMGMRVRRGRAFTEADRDGAQPVVIVNESFVSRFYPDEDPLGQRIIIRDRPQASEIIGIVNDVKHFGPDKDPLPEMYVPYNQVVVGAVPIVVRTELEPEALVGAVRKEIQEVDGEVAIGKVRTMAQLKSAALAERRFALLLLSIFAAIAVALASVGIYGVISYSSTRRTHEIGVRMALGASRGRILQLIIGWVIRTTLVGISMGALGAFALSRMMSNLLFGVQATDMLTFAGASAIILLISLLAGYLPAHRATKVDPAMALRSE